MIVGKGDIASVLDNREGAIIFAAGVSNSQCVDEWEFLREKKMIESLCLNKYNSCFIYFSSMSIFFKTSRYTKHKEEMEDLVRQLYHNHHIIRLGNITWGSNPNTFLNYIKNKMNNNEPYFIQDELKFMISRHTLKGLINSLKLDSGGNTISIFGDAMKVDEAVKTYILKSSCSGQYYLNYE